MPLISDQQGHVQRGWSLLVFGCGSPLIDGLMGVTKILLSGFKFRGRSEELNEIPHPNLSFAHRPCENTLLQNIYGGNQQENATQTQDKFYTIASVQI